MSSSVFLSHNIKDKPFVRRLAKDLKAAGVEVWLDEMKMKIGDSMFATIAAGIEGTDYLAVILSPESVASEWVKKELEIALERTQAKTCCCAAEASLSKFEQIRRW